MKKLLIVMVILTIGFAQNDPYKTIDENFRLFYKVYQKALTEYVDPIDAEKFVSAGLEEMMSVLDPYSIFMDESDKENMEQLSSGKYGGIGAQLSTRADTIIVIAPMEGAPAERVGLHSNDRIIAVNDENIVGKKLSKVAKQIRGEKGTDVELTVIRHGFGELNFTITRDDVKLINIPYAGFVDDGIGYIRVSRFSKTMTADFENELEKMIPELKNGLILDLRGNPGGLLKSAIDILDLFIPEGELLLQTRGNLDTKIKEYFSQSTPLISSDLPLVVLIDKGSASASEIVSGVLQDIDRAVIVGEPSFGKGLVQRVFPLDRDHSIKLTTAKYYLPSGRLIQKIEYNDSAVILDSTEQEYFSENGRKMANKGGIEPDIKLEFPGGSALALQLNQQGLFERFQNRIGDDFDAGKMWDILEDSDFNWRDEHSKHLKFFTTEFDSLNADDQNALKILEQRIAEKRLEKFSEETNIIERNFYQNLYLNRDGNEARYEFMVSTDEWVLKAIEILKDEKKTTELLHQ